MTGFGSKIKKKDIKLFFSPLKLDALRIPPKTKKLAYVGFKTEKSFNLALAKHRSFYGNSYHNCILLIVYINSLFLYNYFST